MYKNQYIIYARKSTDDADNQKNSIDYQVDECLKYIEQRELRLADFTVDGIVKSGIIKEKHSAFKTSDISVQQDGSIRYQINRPRFQKLLQYLAVGKIGVVCLCWDRLSRNDHDGIVIKDLISKGANIHFVQTEYAKSSSGALHMDIDSMFAAHYSRTISEKVRNTNAKLRSEGKCIYVSPIGYLDKGSDNKPLDPERAPLVKRIFELYATGEWSFTQLAKWGNQKGLTTKPLRNKRNIGEMLSDTENISSKVSRPITKKSIENILKNPFYVGKLRFKNEIFNGNHNSLINMSLFNEVQAVLKSKCIGIHYVDKSFFTYRGLIRCSCGRVYSPYKKKGTSYYRARCIKGCSNSDVNLNEKRITDEILALLGKIHFSKNQLKTIEAQAKVGLGKIAEDRDKKLEDLYRQRKRIFSDLDYLKKNKVSLLRNDTYSAREYSDEVRRLEIELKSLRGKMEAYDESEREMLDYVLTFSELLKNAKIYYKNALDTEKREIVTQLFSELIFVDKKLSNYRVKEEFSIVLKHLNVPVGGVDYLFSELHDIYCQLKKATEKMKHKGFFKRIATPDLIKKL